MGDLDLSDRRLKDIGFILKDFLKVIKVVSMYPENNPLPQSLRQSFSERLVSLVEQYGRIRICVQRDVLTLDNQVAFQDRSKEESLAWLFFQAGITDFVFKEDIDVADVYRLLDAIKANQSTVHHSRDLAAQLWEAKIEGFSFGTLEDVALAEYDNSFNLQEYLESCGSDRSEGTPSGAYEPAAYGSIFTSDDAANVADFGESRDPGRQGGPSSAEGHAARARFFAISDSESQATVLHDAGADNDSLRVTEAVQAMGWDDLKPAEPGFPNTTLILNEEFRLTEEEEESIADLLTDDAAFDTCNSTLGLLKELLHQETDMDGFGESVTICEKIMSEFVSQGRLSEAGQLLQYLQRLEQELRPAKPLWAERLKHASIAAGSRDRLTVLSSALNSHEELDAAALTGFLDNFGWEALSGISELLGDLEHQNHRQALCDYLSLRGQDRPDIIGRGVYDKRWYVVRNSVAVLARQGTEKAHRYLQKAVGHSDRRVRLELVTALKDSDAEQALELLAVLVWDADADVARAAIETLVSKRGKQAFETIADAIHDERFVSLAESQRRDLLNAYSELGGDAALGLLSRLILRFNPIREPHRAFYRRAAFEALSRNRSEKGERLLVKLVSSWRPDIRRQASAALQRRREHLFGAE